MQMLETAAFAPYPQPNLTVRVSRLAQIWVYGREPERACCCNAARNSGDPRAVYSSMRNTQAVEKERGPGEALCPRCGAEAEWSFLDTERTRVEVICPDCGRFEAPRAVFDQAEAEIGDVADRDERR